MLVNSRDVHPTNSVVFSTEASTEVSKTIGSSVLNETLYATLLLVS